jgi:hypothetical protein
LQACPATSIAAKIGAVGRLLEPPILTFLAMIAGAVRAGGAHAAGSLALPAVDAT